MKIRSQKISSLLGILLLQAPLFISHVQAAKPTPTPTPSSTQTTYSQYATKSYTAMQRYLYTTNSLYQATYPSQGGNSYSYEWPFTQAMAATSDMSNMPSSLSKYSADVTDRATGMSKYLDANPSFGLPGYDSYVVSPLGNGGDKYHDDNAWAGLNFIRDYRQNTNNTAALDAAKKVFVLLKAGWDTTSTCAPGGVFWKQQTPTETNHDKNTVSNAPSAELGLRLYEITGDQTYFDDAMNMYNWVNTNMKDTDGLFKDHVNTNDCSIDGTKWSYNQGTMIGANVLLYKITGTASYLQEAETIAQAALSQYDSQGYLTQDPAFNAIFFRNLFYLSGYTTNSTLKASIRTAAESYANQIWNNTSIHKKTNLFYFNGSYAKLIDQAAMTEIFALLAQDPSTYESAL